MRFDELGLAPELLRAVSEQGYNEPTPIQAQAIPLVIEGKDLKASAQTGTGKTAAFTLPLLQRLLPLSTPSPSPARHPVRALMLAPTRELAIQVYENLRGYSKYTNFRCAVVYGGVDIKPQIAELKRGIDFLVATPGRLLDHIEQKSLTLGQVEALVLDEADRMLDMGFIPDLKRILNLLPERRQSLLFSATFSEEINRLADSMLKSPVRVEVAKRNAVSETITHRVHPVSAYRKKALLVKLLQSGEFSQVLVFTRTKQETGRLARELQKAGIAADAIHGDKSQLERIKALDAFKNGGISVLVATDVAARGIDIEELPHVINYEIPHVPEDYVHRIGRTGRAGKMGNAVSLVSSEEVGYLAEIEKLIKIQVEQVVVPGYEPDEDYAYPPGARKKRSHEVKAVEQNRQRPPKLPSSSPRKNIAPDGFDFSKPYESAAAKVAPGAEPPKPMHPEGNHTPVGKADPHRPQRVVAALLGGLGRKV